MGGDNGIGFGVELVEDAGFRTEGDYNKAGVCNEGWK